jgi:hypothetical protein
MWRAVVVATVAAGCTPSPPACDPTGNAGGTCAIGAAGQCVEFSALGATDLQTTMSLCAQETGQWRTTACPTANRIGTCTIPPTDPGTMIACSPNAIILERYFPPQYDLTKAMNQCAAVAGTTFTPN